MGKTDGELTGCSESWALACAVLRGGSSLDTILLLIRSPESPLDLVERTDGSNPSWLRVHDSAASAKTVLTRFRGRFTSWPWKALF